MQFEIDDAELFSDLSAQVKAVSRRYAGSYDVEQLIIKHVREMVESSISAIVKDEFSKSEQIREMVRAEMVKSIKSKLKKLEKEAENDPV